MVFESTHNFFFVILILSKEINKYDMKTPTKFTFLKLNCTYQDSYNPLGDSLREGPIYQYTEINLNCFRCEGMNYYKTHRYQITMGL